MVAGPDRSRWRARASLLRPRASRCRMTWGSERHVARGRKRGLTEQQRQRIMHDMSQQQPVAPRWAGRVQRWKIARLYENDALRAHDEELVDDVAYALLARCESMIAVAEAHRGRAPCPVCGETVEHSWDKRAEMRCGCGWTGVWDAYWRSYKDKRLHAGGLEPFCQEYIDRFPAAKTTRDKMLLIDWLIHRFHWEGKEDLPGRPGAVGLIGGTAGEVNAFLDALTLGEHNDMSLRESQQSWRDGLQWRAAEWRQKKEEKRQGAAEAQLRREAKRRRRGPQRTP